MNSFLLACILGHILSLSQALKYECPEPEEIYPCYCDEDEDDDAPSVFCTNLSELDQMYYALKGLKGYKIYKMQFFKNLIFEPVKSNAFEGLAIETLVFERSIFGLPAPQFQGLDQLNSLQLKNLFNSRNPVISFDLSHHKKLSEITLQKNQITTLPNDWIKSAPDSLRTVTVEENTIISMEDKVFAKVKRLTFLSLEANSIVIIKRSMFPLPANDLRTLNLNDNQIKYLPDDIFSEMPKLIFLEMTGNRLRTLGERTWSDIMSQLTKLDILDNPFECDSDLKWLISSKRLPSLFYGDCKKPEKLQGKSLRSLKLEDLN